MQSKTAMWLKHSTGIPKQLAEVEASTQRLGACHSRIIVQHEYTFYSKSVNTIFANSERDQHYILQNTQMILHE